MVFHISHFNSPTPRRLPLTTLLIALGIWATAKIKIAFCPRFNVSISVVKMLTILRENSIIRATMARTNTAMTRCAVRAMRTARVFSAAPTFLPVMLMAARLKPM